MRNEEPGRASQGWEARMGLRGAVAWETVQADAASRIHGGR